MSRSRVSYSQTSVVTYKQFCKEHPELRMSHAEFANIIYSFNYGLRDYLLETGMKGKMPWGMGDFAISKKKPRVHKLLENGHKMIILPVDWKKSKEHGKKIYHMNAHTEGYKFRLKWFIKSARFRDCDLYSFKPSRVTSRLITHYIKLGHQHRYYEWDSIK